LEMSPRITSGNGAVEKRSSAALRCKPHRSTYIYIRLAVRFFARLAYEHIVKSYGFYGRESAIYNCASLRERAPGEQPLNMGFFNNPASLVFSFCCFMLCYKQKQPEISESKEPYYLSMPELSIIIRIKNEEKWVGECLKRLFIQTYKDFEVIAIDSGSTDKTLGIIRNFNVKLFQIKPEQFSYPFALNYGCERASATKYFVFLSGHSLPISKTWLADGIKNFTTDNNIAGIYGYVRALPDGSFWEKFYFNKYRAILKNCFQRKLIIKNQKYGILGFTNAIIRRDLWDRYHFNESYGLGGEDMEWGNYWLQKGFVIIKDIKFSVYHSHGFGLKKLKQQQENWLSLTKPQPFRETAFRK
jgi:rhamnosyltransferase